MRKIILLLIFIPSVTFSQNIDDIFILKKNKELPFLRTASRIKEMTSKDWVNIEKEN